MFGRKKKEEPQITEEVKKPQAVYAGSDEGSNVIVGEQNDPNRIVVMKQSYVGTPDRDFKFSVEEYLMSVVYTEDTGYIDEYLTDPVRPSKYWTKKLFGYKPVDVSVLSFSDQPFTIVTGITFRVPGGDLNGTVRGSFKFVKGNPRSIASMLGSTFAKESTELNVCRKYITAESLENIVRTALQDIIRGPLFKDTIYSDLDELQDVIVQKIKDTPFFFERSIDVSEISVRADRTEIEKLEDSEIKHKILMRENKMEIEARNDVIALAKTEAETFKDL